MKRLMFLMFALIAIVAFAQLTSPPAEAATSIYPTNGPMEECRAAGEKAGADSLRSCLANDPTDLTCSHQSVADGNRAEIDCKRQSRQIVMWDTSPTTTTDQKRDSRERQKKPTLVDPTGGR